MLYFNVYLLETVSAMWLLFMLPWVGLHYVVMVFPDHTHLM